MPPIIHPAVASSTPPILNPQSGLPFPPQAERLVLPDGRTLDDAVICPGFCQGVLGLDPGALFRDLLAIPTWPSDQPIPFRERGDDPHWIDGDHTALRYRGHVLRRGKIWCQSGDYAAGLRRYRYTGWQYRIAPATHAVEHVPPVHRLADALNGFLGPAGHPALNHLIVTRYEDQDDEIGYHSDKDQDFTPDTYFVVVKLGAPRPFAFRLPGATEPFFTRELAAGTAVFVRCKAEAAANSLVQHGVPRLATPVGMSGSIVGRCIQTVVPWAEVRREVERRQRGAKAA